jgi:hypothetical protein
MLSYALLVHLWKNYPLLKDKSSTFLFIHYHHTVCRHLTIILNDYTILLTTFGILKALLMARHLMHPYPLCEVVTRITMRDDTNMG